VTSYVWDGNRLLFELDGAGKVAARYTYDPVLGRPLAMTRGVVTYYYLTDGRGNVAALADATGAAVQSYAYNAFGQTTSSSGSVSNPLLFASRPWDAESGLYYFGARYYYPPEGRFLEREPRSLDAILAGRGGGYLAAAQTDATVAGRLQTPALLHPYAYAANNPLSFTDLGGFDVGAASDVGSSLGDIAGAVGSLEMGNPPGAVQDLEQRPESPMSGGPTAEKATDQAIAKARFSQSFAPYIASLTAETPSSIANQQPPSADGSGCSVVPHTTSPDVQPLTSTADQSMNQSQALSTSGAVQDQAASQGAMQQSPANIMSAASSPATGNLPGAAGGLMQGVGNLLGGGSPKQ
jgi:RHS repeat-associated protein